MAKKIKLAERSNPSPRTGNRVLIVLLILFAVFTIPMNPIMAAGELAVTFLVLIFFFYSNQKRKKALLAYLDQVTGDLETPSHDNLEQSPLPTLVFRPETGDIIWTNSHFRTAIESSESLEEQKLQSIVPDFDSRWLLEGRSLCPQEQFVGDTRFMVYGSLVRIPGKGIATYLATTYWVDVTELTKTRDQYLATKPTVSLILIDNYEDIMRNLAENQSSAVLSAINGKLGQWVEGCNGILKRYARESYLMILERQHLDELVEKKFDILESMREVVSPSGVAATLSIGVGTDGESFEELLKFATLSIDMALTRGGDQVVIRNSVGFDFFGGRNTETEKRTKVKSRVMANTLASLIADSSRVFIMGHKFPDMDVVGAAAGVFALARKKSTPVYIIRQGKDSSAEVLYDNLSTLPEYQEKFLSAQEALLLADSRSLLVVVDTNRPDMVQAIELLDSCTRVAVIDHHKRTSSYIEGAVLNYHELYASSASELVAELLQYTLEPIDLLNKEAEALLAGIVLDTKNFTLRTGGRTFEAAAFLRRCGADTTKVKKLFQNDLEGAISRYKIVQNAQLYRNNIAIACSPTSVGRVVAAQAADELLNIRGVTGSFVLVQDDGEVLISGRAMDDSLNVQLVLEPLGGGGNAAAGGAQLQNQGLDETLTALKKAIDKYLSEA